MKSSRGLLLLLGFLYLGFIGYVVGSHDQLPERVATHFNAAGEPNGWMSRADQLAFMAGFGMAFPLFMIGICWSVRFLPVWMINLPHKEYWLAKERRAESADYVFRHSIWLGCLGLGFVIGLHWATTFSNQRQPVALPLEWVLSITGLFLVGVGAWVICLYRRFRSPDAA